MIEIYTDGSCLNNPGPGGWAYVILENDTIITEDSDFEENTTNNRMELTAIIKALDIVDDYTDDIILYSDSNYAVKGITTWMENWIKKDFKNVKNPDLWKSIVVKLKPTIDFQHVKAHSTNKWNNYVDVLARNKATEVKTKVK